MRTPRTLALLCLALLSVQHPLRAQDAQDWPAALVKFTPASKEPVFNGMPGAWDAKIRERGWILKDGDVFKMWYTGYDGSKEGRRMLGYATSPDGVRWTRHADNPLVREHWVEDMIVVQDGGDYYMFAEGEKDRAHLLTSKDGIAWKRVGPLDVRLKNGQSIPDGPYGTPTAFTENDLWHLLYERNDLGVWLATSKDMKVWTNVRDEPVLKPGPGEFERDLIAVNQVVKHGGYYYAYYHGSPKDGPNAKKWSTGVARSKDLLSWQKYPANPLFPIQENKSSGILVPDGQGFRLYTMHPAVYLHVPPKK